VGEEPDGAEVAVASSPPPQAAAKIVMAARTAAAGQANLGLLITLKSLLLRMVEYRNGHQQV
jgi:hypothetical protein